MSDELMPNEKTNAIDLNELIKKLMNKTILYGIADGYGKITEAESAMIGARDNLVSAIDALRASLAQARQELDALRERERWIPCAERLPEVGETYYVLRKCPDAWDYQIATYKRGAVDGTYFWFSEILAVNLSYVTHYHPLLPEPPSLP